ncbi:DUF3141 domain-containing protein [Stappia sp.]|uniref:DUF3141 domain-containing protein n=1 Tax=Stappia sp. TaxID=1870903 RepID=UPI0032D94B71
MHDHLLENRLRIAESLNETATLQHRLVQTAFDRHARRLQETLEDGSRALTEASRKVFAQLADFREPEALARAGADYLTDTSQRTLLTLDALRKRGDRFIEHEAAGAPPVLVYDYEVAVDGADLPRPCNYILLRITAPEGVETFDWKRPYVIIDPRAGHGPGIGGFKPDSQVGVALRDGHPVYFVAFRPVPEPGQTLADVTHAEAAFLREIHRRHRDAPKPVVVGNCQGGWATAILAATNPDLTGPIVLNGAPMAYWSGKIGQDPMRYTGGMVGGVLPALVSSDLGGGVFDGADLVMNFEMLNPGRTWFRKYYDLYADVDHAEERFLDFEKWWGGFYLMNEAEIRWIVENLFVGNKLARNEARLETGRPIDPKAIRAPIIVFASHGDNITPPPQALNWISDTYSDEREIEIRGQRIIYMIHEQVGHLGIFVSSSVARREHTQMASTLKTIEALPPGLYEMKIEDQIGEGHETRFTVSFHKRKLAELENVGDDGREEEFAFASVARMSEHLAEAYDTTLRPMVQASVSEHSANLMRAMHPLRLQRRALASNNPLTAGIGPLAEQVRATRQQAAPDNPFVALERLWADGIEQTWNVVRDMRAMTTELAFLSLYASPFSAWFGKARADKRARKTVDQLRMLPEVLAALDHTETGGYPEAVVRMLVLMADTRGDVRRDRLQRSAEVLSTHAPFADMDPASRARMIHEQTLIAHFEPERGLLALAELLSDPQERDRAIRTVEYIVGDPDEMEPRTRQLLARMHEILNVGETTGETGDETRAEPAAAPAGAKAAPRKRPAGSRTRKTPATD